MFLTILPTPYCLLIEVLTKDWSDQQGPNSALSCCFLGLPLHGITVVLWRMFETVSVFDCTHRAIPGTFIQLRWSQASFWPFLLTFPGSYRVLCLRRSSYSSTFVRVVK